VRKFRNHRRKFQCNSNRRTKELNS
jgi:hypothetical protein